MNREEAIQAMREGKKVTHTYFSENEWMSIRGDHVILEDGYSCLDEEFWSYRTAHGWEDGYSLFIEKDAK